MLVLFIANPSETGPMEYIWKVDRRWKKYESEERSGWTRPAKVDNMRVFKMGVRAKLQTPDCKAKTSLTTKRKNLQRNSLSTCKNTNRFQ